jgi:hypothetical protein
MAELKIKRGSLLIQLWEERHGTHDCVFATTLYPIGGDHGKIHRISFEGWKPGKVSQNAQGHWEVELEVDEPES